MIDMIAVLARCIYHKKIKFVLILSFLVAGINSYAQEACVDNYSIINLNDSLSSYYKFVYAGEEFIMKKRYVEALEAYQSAFSYVENPFPFDLLNYREVAVIEGHEEIVSYVDSISESVLEKKDIVGDTLSDAFFLRNMMFEDQNDRSKAYEATNRIYEGEYGATIKKRDSSRFVQFTERFGRKGIPSCYEIGSEHFGLFPRDVRVLLSHWRSQGFDINQMLVDAVEAGKIRAMDAAFLLDKGECFGIPLAYKLNGNQVNTYSNLTENELKGFTHRRRKFYLEDYSSYIQKFEFQNSTKSKFKLIRLANALLSIN